MSQVIMWNLVTLDGCFEGTKPWSLDWHEDVWGEELERLSIDQLQGADLLLFGRATYDGMAAYWPSAQGQVADLMNGIAKVVFSNTLAAASWNNTRLVRGPAEDEVARLKAGRGRDILIFGSAVLCDALLRRALIDELRLAIVPVVLGGGTALFKPSPDRMRLTLLEAKALRSGCVVARYRPAA